MISPDQIKKKAQRKYFSFLQSSIEDLPFSRIEIRGDKNYTKSSLPDFEKEMLSIISQSKAKRGHGYTLEFQKVKTKHLGTQDLPTAIYFDTKKDFLKYLGKEKETELFKQDYLSIITDFPELKDWVVKNPSKIIQNHGHWEGILKVCNYFKKNPQPNLYIRELPIQLHTKFIERNQSIIKDLLDVLIWEYSIQEEKQFEKRFNLKFSEPQVRFKILDKAISQNHFQGLDDIAIPISQFESLELPLERVLIVENKTTLYTTLTLPKMDKTIAVFGSGYAVNNLKNVSWLLNVELLYWGDIDVQGFEILSQFRSYFSNAKSILMDKETFQKFFENDTGVVSGVSAELNLTMLENTLYQLLRTNNWRLEQEKIPLDHVKGFFGSG
jgi:hypothetical protein